MERINNFLLFATLAFVHSFMAGSAIPPMNITNDPSALLALKSSIIDPQKILASKWSSTTNASVCNWIGITCGSYHRRVIALNLSDMGLSGTISPHIGNLSFLNSLDVSSNNFHGNLPNEIAHLRRLRVIKFNLNNFTGSIPSWFGLLPKLRFLHLGNNSFTGTLPPSLSNVSTLETLILDFNFLQGKIPQDIDNLQSLKLLKMQGNKLTGLIPLTIFNISSLEFIAFTFNVLSGNLPNDMCHRLPHLRGLYLSENEIEGQLPPSLSKCSKLEILSLSYNNFSGTIPRDIGNLTMLKSLLLGVNKLQGEIPQEIGNLHKLERAGFDSNNLTGPIPPMIFNMSTLRLLLAEINRLSGQLPSNINLPNIEIINLAMNNLSGEVPDSISNASRLSKLEISYNQFSGSIPNSLGNLEMLTYINLKANKFQSRSSSQELSFLTSLTRCRYLTLLSFEENYLHGTLPASVGNLSTSLVQIFAGSNGIKGRIPDEIGNLSSLITLSLRRNDLIGSIPRNIQALTNIQGLFLSYNKLNGKIPSTICQLRNLAVLYFQNNRLAGSLPSCLGNIASLRNVDLSSNRLTSSIPTSLWNLKDLVSLNLSLNLLVGTLAPNMGNLQAVTVLDLSRNQVSGNIPSTIQGLANLNVLSLAHNRLDGLIPEQVGNLPSLEYLDLSYNDLSGVIPNSMEKLKYLQYLNVSFNRLSGQIPKGGPFGNFSRQSFMSNEALCGAPLLQFPPCRSHKSKAKKIPLVVYIGLPSIFMMLALAFAFIMTRRPRKKVPPQEDLLVGITPVRISYFDLQHATNGFSENHLLGVGSYGSVFKGIFRDGTLLAIKVFNLQLEGASRSFEKECEILGSLRHRNLVQVISCCYNIDFIALVLEYMPNGSLEKWLYSHDFFLDTFQRLDISIDVACALEYLHHGYSAPVIHCDLKPSNVLLDENMVAHVSDFGNAKLFDQGQSKTLTKAIATLGYIAPEYGLQGLVSRSSDVYSFGIMLMEIFTRKKPSDEIFVGDLSIKNWIEKSILSNDLTKVIDAKLLRPEYEQMQLTGNVECVSSILKVALKCSAEAPEDRMNIKNALSELRKIRVQFLASCGRA